MPCRLRSQRRWSERTYQSGAKSTSRLWRSLKGWWLYKMEQQIVKSASEVVTALVLQCSSPDCGRCPYWEFDNCKSRMKRDAVSTASTRGTWKSIIGGAATAASGVLTRIGPHRKRSSESDCPFWREKKYSWKIADLGSNERK